MKWPILLTLASAALAQDKAMITVYAPGGYWRGATGRAAAVGVGVHDAPSQAFVFDGDQKLVLLTPGRFVTFEMVPGSHQISTSTSKKDKPVDPSYDLKAGNHYFLRLSVTTKGAWIIQSYRPRLELVSCEKARSEADGTKAVDAKRIDKEARSQVVDGTYFPRCETSEHPSN